MSIAELTYEQAKEEIRLAQQRIAILEAQTGLSAKQQNDATRAQAAQEANRFNQARRHAEIADHHRKQEIQRLHDAAFEAHNLTTPMPRADESSSAYHRRLLRDHLQKYSPEYRAVDLNHVPPTMLENVASRIVADALSPVSHSFDLPEGQIKEIIRKDESGRPRHEFVSSDKKTTFISEMNAALPRRMTAAVGGRFVKLLDFVNGALGTEPRSGSVSKPNSISRQLYGGLPRA